MTITPIKDTPKNRRIKYAWLRQAGYNRAQAKAMCRDEFMPKAFYRDLDKWFFYIHGQLIPDPSEGYVNRMVEAIERRGKKLLKLKLGTNP